MHQIHCPVYLVSQRVLPEIERHPSKAFHHSDLWPMEFQGWHYQGTSRRDILAKETCHQ